MTCFGILFLCYLLCMQGNREEVWALGSTTSGPWHRVVPHAICKCIFSTLEEQN